MPTGLNIQFPSLGRVMAQGEQIRGMGLQNAIRQQQLQGMPSQLAMQQQLTEQKLEYYKTKSLEAKAMLKFARDPKNFQDKKSFYASVHDDLIPILTPENHKQIWNQAEAAAKDLGAVNPIPSVGTDIMEWKRKVLGKKEELSFEEKEQIKAKYRKPDKPEKTLSQIKAEAKARAEGSAEGKPDKPTGTLTENQVSQSLLDLAMSDSTAGGTVQTRYAKYYNQFRQLVSSGISREDALNQLLQEKNTINAGPTGKSYKHLWDK